MSSPHKHILSSLASQLGHAIPLILCVAFTSNAVWAAPLVPIALTPSADLEQVRATVHRGGAVVGARGGVVVRRGTAVAGPRGNVAVRRTTVVRPGGRWARPGWYRWPVGGAIAAGAAIGFVTAATAAAWAGAPPTPVMCWYYTDPSRTQGFWDYCAQ